MKLYKKGRFNLKKLIVFIVSLLLLVGCNQTKHNQKLEKLIQTAISKENIQEFDLKSLTDFDWNKAFLFPPYTVQETIDEQLGTQFKDPSNMDKRDDIYLLVFMKGNKVVQYTEVRHESADISIGERKYLTPSNALINIEIEKSFLHYFRIFYIPRSGALISGSLFVMPQHI